MINIEREKTLLAQLIARGLIFVLFFLGVFVAISSFFIYFLMLLIMADLILGFVNGKKSIFANITLLLLSLLLFVFLIEYIATIVGTAVSFFHALFFAIKYFRKTTSAKNKLKK